MKHIYFPGLNTIRLYAAISVVLVHAASYAGESGYMVTSTIPAQLNWIILSGYDAVSLFFVLSGFLITYILLNERHQTSTIDVKRFYIKRALRIQPLYFLLIGITLLSAGFAPQPSTAGLLAVVMFFPYFMFAVRGAVGHLWSVGVEEWFYFALPPLLRRVSVPRLAAGVIGVRLLMTLFIPGLMLGDPYINLTMNFWHALRFECMAIGALGAWMLINRHWFVRWIYCLELPNLVFLALFILFDFPGGVAFNLVSSCVFLVFIMNVATNSRHRLGLELPLFARWGAVTYGVYMYHPLVTHGIASLFAHLGIHSDIALYAVIVVAVLIVAHVSYRVFEQPIMRLRDKQVQTPAVVVANN